MWYFSLKNRVKHVDTSLSSILAIDTSRSGFHQKENKVFADVHTRAYPELYWIPSKHIGTCLAWSSIESSFMTEYSCAHCI